jgi:phosphatidylserine/phosphatidylglycerophosphate/cardiolipin synthase-like enzyme
MTKLIFYNLSFFLLLSCTFYRARLHKSDHSCPPAPVAPLSFEQALMTTEEQMKNETAVYSLENGGQSLLARLWLLDEANSSLDIQYYSFSNDVTGLIAANRIVNAADRGVKVRILIDDAASRLNSREVRLLDSHDNVEVKVFNAGLKLGRLDKRVDKLSKNLNRMMRRMHNKTFTVDGKAGILGGRNVADRYFDYSRDYNFRDRDLLLFGKAVIDIRQSFEEFWNSDLSIPYSRLSASVNKRKYRDPKRFDDLHCYAEETKDFSPAMRDRAKNFHEELKKASQSGELVWAKNMCFISDKPQKVKGLKPKEGSTCTDSLASLIRQARSSVDIDSPYFITTDSAKKLLRETVQRGVKIRVLTNSLESTDNYEAFSGYQRDRKSILETGVQVYEFKPDAKVRYKLMVPEVQATIGYEAVYGFHPKTVIIDSSVVAVGSYNFDPRSANYNTECIAIVRSLQTVKNLSKHFEEEILPENAWEVTKKFNADSKANLRKRFRVMTRRIIPKRWL